MRLFTACLIIYGLDLHWALYIVAFGIVGWQWGQPLVLWYIEESARIELGKRLLASKAAILANMGNLEFLSWQTDRPQDCWVTSLEDAAEKITLPSPEVTQPLPLSWQYQKRPLDLCPFERDSH